MRLGLLIALLFAAATIPALAGVAPATGVALPSKLSSGVPAYDPVYAKESAWYASVAYCDVDMDTWNCGPPCQNAPAGVGFSRLLHFRADDADTWAYTAFNNQTNEVVVGFRGTDGVKMTEDSVLNWITNLDAISTQPYPDQPAARVHRGFYLALQGILPQIWPLIDQLIVEHPTATARLIGHSLGGALATLCAVDVRRKYPALVLRVTTFGQPRVGNKAFTDYYGSEVVQQHFRVVHHDDIVPHVPTQWMDYLHVATEVWYDLPFVTYKVCPAPADQENPTCMDSVPLWDYSVHDHMTYFIDVSGQCTKAPSADTAGSRPGKDNHNNSARSAMRAMMLARGGAGKYQTEDVWI